MSDLTKLTADELRVRFDVLRPRMNVPARLVLAEISRRLERLEKCEAALLKARMLLISEGDPDEDS